MKQNHKKGDSVNSEVQSLVQNTLQQIRSKHRVELDNEGQFRGRNLSSSPTKSLVIRSAASVISSEVPSVTVPRRGRPPKGSTSLDDGIKDGTELESLVEQTLKKIRRQHKQELSPNTMAPITEKAINKKSTVQTLISQDSPTKVSGDLAADKSSSSSNVPSLRSRATISSPPKRSILPAQIFRRSLSTTISALTKKISKKRGEPIFVPELAVKLPSTEERSTLVPIEDEPIMAKAGPGFRLFVRSFTDEHFTNCVYNPLLNTTRCYAPTNLRYISILRNAWKSLSETKRQEWHKFFARLSSKNLLNTAFKDKTRWDLSVENVPLTERQISDRKWLDSIDVERLPCALCTRENPRRYNTPGLLAHIGLSHPAIRLYACHCCTRAFDSVTALKSHSEKCTEFAKYLRKYSANLNEVIFDFAYLALICAGCGLQIALSPLCNDEAFASAYFNILLSHSTQNFALLIAFSCVELPNNSVRIAFLRPAFVNATLHCAKCDFRAMDCAELERHCASEHREECIRKCPLKCTTSFFTDATFNDHLLVDHMPDQPLICQFLQSATLMSAALDKSACVRVGADPPRVPPNPSDNEKTVRKSVRKRKPLSAIYGGDWCVDWDGDAKDSADSRDASPRAAGSNSSSPQPSSQLSQPETFIGWQKKMAASLDSDASKSPVKRASNMSLHTECVIEVGYREGGPMIVQNPLDGGRLLTADIFQCSKCSAIVSGASAAQAHISECLDKQPQQQKSTRELVKLFDSTVQLPFVRIRCAKCPSDHCSIQALRRHYAQEHAIICRFRKDGIETVESCAKAVLDKGWLETAFDHELAELIARSSRFPMQCKSEVESAMLDSPDYFPLLPTESSSYSLADSTFPSSNVTGSPASSLSFRECKSEPMEAVDDGVLDSSAGVSDSTLNDPDKNPRKRKSSSAGFDYSGFSSEDLQPTDHRLFTAESPPKKRQLSSPKKAPHKCQNSADAAGTKETPDKATTPDSGVASLPPTKSKRGGRWSSLSASQRMLRPRRSGGGRSPKKLEAGFDNPPQEKSNACKRGGRRAGANVATASTHQKASKRVSSAEQPPTRKSTYSCFLCPAILPTAELWEQHLANHSDFSLEEFEASEEFCIVEGEQKQPSPQQPDEEDEEIRAVKTLASISTFNSKADEDSENRNTKWRLVFDKVCAADESKEDEDDDSSSTDEAIDEAMSSDEAIVRSILNAIVEEVSSKDAAAASNNNAADDDDDVKVLSANCSDCQLKFASLEEASNHRETYHKKLLFPLPKNLSTFLCRACCIAFSDHTAYLAHTETHRQMLIACKRCSLVSSGRDHFTEHRRFHDMAVIRRQFACSVCAVYYTDELKLAYHLAKIHKMTLAYFCKLCGLCSTDLRVVEKHIFDEPCSTKMNMDFIGVCDSAQLRFIPISHQWYNRQLGLGALVSVPWGKCRHLCLSAPEPSETMVTCQDCRCPIPLSVWNAIFRRLKPDSPLKEESFSLAIDDRTFRTTAEVFFALTAYHDGPGPTCKLPSMPTINSASWSENEEKINQYVNAVKVAVCRQVNKEKDQKQRMLLVKKLQHRQSRFSPSTTASSTAPTTAFQPALSRNNTDHHDKPSLRGNLPTVLPSSSSTLRYVERYYQQQQQSRQTQLQQPKLVMQRPPPQILASSRRPPNLPRIVPVTLESVPDGNKTFILKNSSNSSSSQPQMVLQIQSSLGQPTSTTSSSGAQRPVHALQQTLHRRQMPQLQQQRIWNNQMHRGSLVSIGAVQQKVSGAVLPRMMSAGTARGVGPPSQYYSNRQPGSYAAPSISMVRVVKEGSQQQPMIIKAAAAPAPPLPVVSLDGSNPLEQNHHPSPSPYIDSQHRFFRIMHNNPQQPQQ